MTYIMIVDDDPNILEMLCETLELLDHHVVCCHNGRDALEWLARSGEVKPALILCDSHMPIMDGVTLLRCIRDHSRWTSIPFVMFSGCPDDQTQAIQQGADDFVSKPFRLETLEILLKQFMSVSQTP